MCDNFHQNYKYIESSPNMILKRRSSDLDREGKFVSDSS